MALTTTRKYRWDDAGAPSLSGTAGSLKNLIKTLLYGDGSGISYGAGGSAKSAAGWTMPFSDTATKCVLRNSLAAGGSGCYLQITDDASGAGGAKEAFARAFSAMSDINTGVDQMPTTAQLSAGCIWRKSTTADSTARKWVAVADERSFYMSVECDPVAGNFDRMICAAGDFDSMVPGDAYNYFIAGKTFANYGGGSETWLNTTASFGTPSSASGLWIAKSYAQTGNSIAAAICSIGNSGTIGGSGMADPAVGSLSHVFAPAMIVSEGIIRGFMRGAFVSVNDLSGRPFGSEMAALSGMPAGSVLSLLVANPLISSVQCRLPIESARPW